MSDKMQDALEAHVEALIRDSGADVRTICVGEPFVFPTAWFPLAVIFCRSDTPAVDDEYAPQETELEYFAYAFYVSVEVAFPEAMDMKPDSAGHVEVPSYREVKRRIEAIRQRLNAWQNDHDSDRVIVNAGQPDEEASAQIVMGRRDTGQENRGDSWSQRALVEFVIYTHRPR